MVEVMLSILDEAIDSGRREAVAEEERPQGRKQKFVVHPL
jgi:hypothetical protein